MEVVHVRNRAKAEVAIYSHLFTSLIVDVCVTGADGEVRACERVLKGRAQLME